MTPLSRRTNSLGSALTPNATHRPNLRSWVESANHPSSRNPSDHFPIQNLPVGVFKHPRERYAPKIGVAIGDRVLDIKGCVQLGLLDHLDPKTRKALTSTTLNSLMGLDRSRWSQLRNIVSELLQSDSERLRDNLALRDRLVLPRRELEMLSPVAVGDYTDYYASIHHARNVGSMFRPDNPLLPNYTHMPIAYHGRGSSIVVSGTPVRRPMGQIKPATAEVPHFGPTASLDYEMELGMLVGGRTLQGSRLSMEQVLSHIFGMLIVNDWSARDIQAWEYQPLGPFNAKNFATTISPWVVTLEALAPYLVPSPAREDEDAALLDYLKPTQDMAIDITVEVYLLSEKMRAENQEPMLFSRGNFADMYWTIAQMLAHHTVTGCPMNPGDLLASGTISGPTVDSRGCLLERTWRGRDQVELPDGTKRAFLKDGDEVIMRAYAQREGWATVGFGEARGIVIPAH